MTCPKCTAKLMPVDGEMFCLQCGTLVAAQPKPGEVAPPIEETTDPILQKAIEEAVGHPMHFRMPVGISRPPKTAAFSSMRTVLAPSSAVLAGAGVAPQVPVPATPTAGPPIVKPDQAVNKKGVHRQPRLPGIQIHLDKFKHASLKAKAVWWLLGIVVVAFMALNIALAGYFGSRVYPGVKVNNMALGGIPLSEVEGKIQRLLPAGSTEVVIDSTKYVVQSDEFMRTNAAEVISRVKSAGREHWLPVLGVVFASTSRPISAQSWADESAAQRLAETLARQTAQPAINAEAKIVNGQVLVTEDKPGTSVDSAALKAALVNSGATESRVILKSAPVRAQYTTADYANDVALARARLGLNVRLNVRSRSYRLSANDIGNWLSIGAPGQLRLSGAGVSAYVAALPGNFDRAAAANALMGALTQGRSLSYTASTKRTTAAPNLQDVVLR